MAKITIIPPKEKEPEILNVAAYCRVSSDSADQLHSYAAQIRSYTELISRHDDWELVDIYADEGLTGTRMDQREDFNRMLSDCRKGRIDKILVKSVSRFARNTTDCLTTLRELSSMGVTVYFEEENIDTKMLTTELMVSISGALAQQESISISQNQRMSYKRRMEKGDFITNTAPFGYRLVEGRNLEIVPEEAEQVRFIFNAYLDGKSLEWIAKQMSQGTAGTSADKMCWQTSTVLRILKNEKYVGDTLCQKWVTHGFPFIKRRNHGEKDQYYIENTHPAIITHEIFDKVQVLRNQKGKRNRNPHIVYPLTLKIYCANCGTPFIRRTIKDSYAIWVCRKHNKNAEDCPMGRIPENEIYAAFVRMYNKLRLHAGVVLTPAVHQLEDLEEALHRDNPAMLEINRAIAKASEQNHNITKLQASGLMDADACAAKLATLHAQLTRLRTQRRKLMQNLEINDAVEAIRQTVDAIRQGPEHLDSFDEALFTTLVERMIAESQTTLRFQLYGGMEIREQLWGVRR